MRILVLAAACRKDPGEEHTDYRRMRMPPLLLQRIYKEADSRLEPTALTKTS